MNFRFERLNTESLQELRAAAIIHESAPLNWDPGYKVTEDRVLFWIDYLKKIGSDEDAWIMTAKTDSNAIIGLHWIKVEKRNGQSCAKIESLWSSDQHRRQGIGSKLKTLGEQWAISKGAKMIVTDVFYSNERMIEFNIKRGFKPMQVEMLKTL